MAGSGIILMAVSSLFALVAHEDIKQADRLERALALKAERAGNQAQTESIEMVFDAETSKLRCERRGWLWATAAAAVATTAGLVLAWAAPRARQRSRTPDGSAPHH